MTAERKEKIEIRTVPQSKRMYLQRIAWIPVKGGLKKATKTKWQTRKKPD